MIATTVPAEDFDDYLRASTSPGEFFLSYSVRCPRCHATLDWPQVWTIKEN